MELLGLLHAARALDLVSADLVRVYSITFGIYFSMVAVGYGLWLALRVDDGRAGARRRHIVKA
jgi:hypothetical protein